MSGGSSIVEQIAHYQRKIERYIASDEGDKLLYVIHKLKYLKVTVGHLEETGVGRDVNALRHRDGLVGEKARALVNKWKDMVTAEEEEEEEEEEKPIENKRQECDIPNNVDGEKWDQVSENDENDRLQIEENVSEVEENEAIDSANSGIYDRQASVETEDDDDAYNPITAKQDYLKVTNNKIPLQEYIPSHSSENIEYDDFPSSGGLSPPSEYKPTNISRDSDESKSLSSTAKKSRSDKEREKEYKDRHKSKNREKDRDREREKGNEKIKESSKSLEKEKKDKHREKDKDKEREKSHKHKQKDKDRDKEKEREKEKYRESEEKKNKSEEKKEKIEDKSIDNLKIEVVNGFSSKESDNKKKSSDRKGGDEKDKRKENKDLSSTNREKDKKSESRLSDKHGDKHSDKQGDKHGDKHGIKPGVKPSDKPSDKHGDRISENSSDKHNDKYIEKHKSGESNHRGADSKQLSGADVKKNSRKDHDSENKDKKKYTDKKEDSDKKNKEKSSDREKDKDKKERSSDREKDKDNKERSSDKEKDKDKKKKSKRASPDPFMQALMGGGSDTSSKKKKKKKKDKDNDNEREDSEEENIPSTSKRLLSSPPSVPDPKKPRLLNINPMKLPDLPDFDVEASLLPEISSNYRPLPRMNYKDDLQDLPKLSDEELLSQMMSSKTSRGRKLYSGNVKGLDHVATLYESCMRSLIENIDSLEATGGIPYEILKPVLERCTWRQLFNLENFNAYLLDDTDVLWENYCRKDFRNKKKMELETYREMYLRCFDEREDKLRSLTANLKQKQIGTANAKSATKVAFIGTSAKAPKNVLRAQAKWGTAVSPAKPLKTASSSAPSAASGVREDLAARKRAMENIIRTERAAGPKLTQAQKKRKMAPMMAKTQQFYKKAFRR